MDVVCLPTPPSLPLHHEPGALYLRIGRGAQLLYTYREAQDVEMNGLDDGRWFSVRAVLDEVRTGHGSGSQALTIDLPAILQAAAPLFGTRGPAAYGFPDAEPATNAPAITPSHMLSV